MELGSVRTLYVKLAARFGSARRVMTEAMYKSTTPWFFTFEVGRSKTCRNIDRHTNDTCSGA